MIKQTLSIIAISTLTACAGLFEPELESEAPEFSITDLALLRSSNNFGLQLFQRTAIDSIDNVVISPVSISMALGMTLNGADSTTYDSMRTVLGFDNFTEDEINTSYKNLIAELTGSDPGITMEIANSIWTRLGWTFAADFLARCENSFDAVVEALDFSDPAAVTRINNWVDEKTHGKISKIVEPPIGEEIVMFLINALYFKGTWTHEFDPDDTDTKAFTTGTGPGIAVPTMMQEETLPYLDHELVQGVDLPYGDEYFSMSIYLPKESVHIDSVIGLMTDNAWDGWMTQFEETAVHLEMPSFKLEYKSKLNNVLKDMGMSIAFSPDSANFLRMLPSGGSYSGNLYIDEVMHKTFIEVNEEGTEAAAATSIGMGFTSVPTYTDMKVNRPFIFVIRERASKALLFMGKVVDPS